MMGVEAPETCWVTHKPSSNKPVKQLHLVGWFIWIILYDHQQHHQHYSPWWALVSFLRSCCYSFVTAYFCVVCSPRPNPQLGEPGYPFLYGPSPLTCPALEALPVATPWPAWLSGSFDHATAHHYFKLLCCMLQILCDRVCWSRGGWGWGGSTLTL
jgi:hypothetical protein